MAIYDYLPKHHVVEANNLKGLQPGFVVAQMNVAEDSVATLVKDGLMDNGHICMITKDGIKLWTKGVDTPVLFLHYTEPLNTVFNSDKFFAVDVENECPRLVQLIPGDEWTTDIDYATDDTYTSVREELMKHIVEIKTGDAWYENQTLADGTKAHHYMFLG